MASEAWTLLDGGLATELEGRGLSLDDPLWSGRVLLEQPEMIEAVHLDYLIAGADVVTTATYQIGDEALARRGLAPSEIEGVYRRAIDLAVRARDRGVAATGRRALVLGSVGSYGAALADGSEYRGTYLGSGDARVDDDLLAAHHEGRLRALVADPRVDVILLETFPGRREVALVADLVRRMATASHVRVPPVWASLSCRDAETVSDGEALSEAARSLADRVAALGVNCTDPRAGALHVAHLRRGLKGQGTAMMIYPNAGEHYGECEPGVGGWCGERLGPEPFAGLAASWRSEGATILGGCCRTTPAHIAAMRAVLSRTEPWRTSP